MSTDVRGEKQEANYNWIRSEGKVKFLIYCEHRQHSFAPRCTCISTSYSMILPNIRDFRELTGYILQVRLFAKAHSVGSSCCN